MQLFRGQISTATLGEIRFVFHRLTGKKATDAEVCKETLKKLVVEFGNSRVVQVMRDYDPAKYVAGEYDLR